MKKLLGILVLGLLWCSVSIAETIEERLSNIEKRLDKIEKLLQSSEDKTSSYEDAVSKWKSYKDVATWLNRNFGYDTNRQKQMRKLSKKKGLSGLVVRNPASLYEDNHNGYCGDSANFAIKSLNKIDPSYNARWVFIFNDKGSHHWVAAFDHDGKLYIMDYGTGRKWEPMQGVHGPYNSLDEYRDYLSSLSLPKFGVDGVIFRNMPGQED